MWVSTFLLAAAAVPGGIAAPPPPPYQPPRVPERRLDLQAKPRGEALLSAAMLDVHNAARAKAGIPPLAWSDALAADAARWAAVLGATRDFRHSPEPRGKVPQGENLFIGTRDAYAYQEMAQMWVDERRDYKPGAFPDVSGTGSWHDVGHYTQILWRRTTQVGCALASSASDDYLVCRYAPPGNVLGRRAED